MHAVNSTNTITFVRIHDTGVETPTPATVSIKFYGLGFT